MNVDEQADVYRAQRDDMLRELEGKDLPSWVWAVILERLARWADILPPDMGWFPVRYLQSVKYQGAKMFRQEAVQTALLDDGRRPTDLTVLVCPCNGRTAPARMVRRGGGFAYVAGTCQDCGAAVVEIIRRDADT